jgi:hypothetical protein
VRPGDPGFAHLFLEHDRIAAPLFLQGGDQSGRVRHHENLRALGGAGDQPAQCRQQVGVQAGFGLVECFGVLARASARAGRNGSKTRTKGASGPSFSERLLLTGLALRQLQRATASNSALTKPIDFSQLAHTMSGALKPTAKA